MRNTSERPADEIEKVVKDYGDMLFRLSLLMLGNSADAKDIVQETMIKYLKKSPVFENEEHLKAWLITVTRNLCRDKLRFNKNHPVVDIDELKNIAGENVNGEVFELLIVLPEKIKSVMILYYVEGFTIKEIAKTSGKTESAIKMRLQKGRRLLAEKYRKEFI